MCPYNIGYHESGFYSCTTNYGEGTLLKRPKNACEVHIHNFDNQIIWEEIEIKKYKKNLMYLLKLYLPMVLNMEYNTVFV